MKRTILILVAAVALATPATTPAAEPAAPKGLRAEGKLADRYPCVVRDMLKYCRPKKGFWVDLGAGRGQVAISLIAATGNPVVMIDPDADAMAEGLRIAREKGIEDRLFAVVGVAEKLPLADGSVDLVVSRGAIFFFDDPVAGLREVYRVLRPGGKAYIGGGAGSSYPKEDTEKLIAERKERMQGEEAEKWKRFVELRRPEQMQAWAEAARLPKFEVMGKGAISADDPRVGQGVWLLFEKQPEVTTRKAEDKVTRQTDGDAAVYTIESPSGIGGATLAPSPERPKRIVLRLKLRGLESLTVDNGLVQLRASVLSHSGHRRLLAIVEQGEEKPVEKGSPYWSEVRAMDAQGRPIDGLPGEGGWFEIELPAALLKSQPKSLSIDWIDFYR